TTKKHNSKRISMLPQEKSH
ncbi:unnamed protein product, partial [Allacma fusca]